MLPTDQNNARDLSLRTVETWPGFRRVGHEILVANACERIQPDNLGLFSALRDGQQSAVSVEKVSASRLPTAMKGIKPRIESYDLHPFNQGTQSLPLSLK